MASSHRSPLPYPAIAERGRPPSSNAEVRDVVIADASAAVGRIAGNRARTAEAYTRDGARNDAAGAGRAYAGGDGGTGGKIRSSRRSAIALNRKRTPYDRPPVGPHAARVGSAASPASSITSRIVDSASRLISSSASFLFSSLFKRQPPAIANGDGPPALEFTVDEEEVGVQGEPILSQTENHDTLLLQEETPVANGNYTGKETDLAQVEQILKQQIWSREQVNRLTEILQTQLQENNAVSSNTGEQRQLEQPGKLQNDVVPVQVARAYMESRPSSSAATGSLHGISNLPDKVSELQLLPVRGLSEDRYRTSYTTRALVMSPVAGRKRSVLDADLGVVRRVRQKTMLQASPSPYARSRPLMSPPIRSTETASRILETLEKLSPSPKGKSPEGQVKVTTTKHLGQAPETSKAREKSSLTSEALTSLQKEPGPSNGRKSLVTPLSTVNFVTDVLSTTEPPWSPAIIPEKTISLGSPVIAPERTKGFRMSAIFEETNSDEENRLNILETSARHPSVFSVMEPAQASLSKPSLEPLFKNASTATELGDGSVSTVKSSPAKEDSDATPLGFISSELPAHTSTAIDLHVSPPIVTSSAMDSLSPAVPPFPSFSLPSYATEPKPSFSCAQSAADSSVSMAKEVPIFSRATAAASAVAVADSSLPLLKVPVTEKVVSPLTSSALALVPLPPQAPLLTSMAPTVSEAAPISQLPSLSASSASSASLLSSSLVITSLSATVAAPASVLSAIASAAPNTLSTPESMSASPLTTPVTPVAVTTSPSLGGTPVTPAVVEVLPDGDNGAIMATEAMGTEKVPEVETMSSDPMSEEPDASTVLPPVTTFQFGSSPASSSPLGTTFSFGSGGPATPSSAFSFATGASTSSSTSFLFGNQTSSSSSTGQLFSFGPSSTSTLANPFGATSTTSSMNPFSGGNVAPAFPFGSSSTGTTTSPTFGSSAFSATVSASSTFSFGGTSSSTSMSSSSSSGQMFGFGGQGHPAPSAGPFGTSGSSSSAFTFTSSPANASLGAPTFAFGSGGSTSLSSGSSFSGQPFAFGAQPNSPFSSSGAPSSTPAFTFGSSSTASGSTSTPAFAFGAQPGASSAGQPFGGGAAFGQMGPSQPFGVPTFGSSSSAAQPYGGGPMLGAPAAAQPFTFGGQPSLPAQSPFPPGGPPANAFSQGQFEFAAGGFALGATGGEKSGRKYIKAKRGPSKRGK